MKKLFLILMIFILFFGCEIDDTQDKKIIGYIGDSITSANDWENGINYGIAGNSTLCVLDRIDTMDCDIAFLMIGINDLAYNGEDRMDEIAYNLHQILLLLQVDIVYVISVLPNDLRMPPPDYSGYVSWDTCRTYTNEDIKQLNELYKQNLTHNAIFIDCHNLFANEEGYIKPEYTVDGIHLSKEGYLLLESIYQEMIFNKSAK